MRDDRFPDVLRHPACRFKLNWTREMIAPICSRPCPPPPALAALIGDGFVLCNALVRYGQAAFWQAIRAPSLAPDKGVCVAVTPGYHPERPRWSSVHDAAPDRRNRVPDALSRWRARRLPTRPGQAGRGHPGGEHGRDRGVLATPTSVGSTGSRLDGCYGRGPSPAGGPAEFRRPQAIGCDHGDV